MHEWTIEADIRRYQQALADTTDADMRDRLTHMLGLARQRLFEANGATRDASHVRSGS